MRPVAPLLLSALILLLAGCGFHLRGDVDIPQDWTQLALQTPSPNGELANAINNGFTAAGVSFVDRPDANYVLQVGPERFTQENLTIGANARATEFELIMTTSLRVVDSQGEEVMPRTEVSAYRVMTNNINNVTGKVEEVRLLQREMRVDLVQNIMRRIRFLASNSGSA